MTELPISEFMRNYYKEIGFEFIDSQKATIIWNSSLPRDEINSALREIAGSTSDNALKEQINERIEYEEKQEKLFFGKSDGCLYAPILDDESAASGFFTAPERAVSFGKANCERCFRVDKIKPCDDPEKPYDIIGTAYYNKDAVLSSVWSDECEPLDTPENKRFEMQYFSVNHPFKRGDIVRYEGDSIAGVVGGLPESKSFDERVKSGEIDFADFSDILLHIEYLTEDGEISYDHINPLYLEKVTELDDELERQVLTAASELIKGNGSIDDFMWKLEENKRKDG